MRFIDEHQDVFGVEPVCRVLTQHGWKIAPSTYYAARSRLASARSVRDEQLKAEIVRIPAARRDSTLAPLHPSRGGAALTSGLTAVLRGR